MIGGEELGAEALVVEAFGGSLAGVTGEALPVGRSEMSWRRAVQVVRWVRSAHRSDHVEQTALGPARPDAGFR